MLSNSKIYKVVAALALPIRRYLAADLIWSFRVVHARLPLDEAPEHRLGVVTLRRPEICSLGSVGGQVVPVP